MAWTQQLHIGDPGQNFGGWISSISAGAFYQGAAGYDFAGGTYWRVLKRLAVDGSLVWNVGDPKGTLGTYPQALEVFGANVYIAGWNSPMGRVECRNVAAGGVVWNRVETSPGAFYFDCIDVDVTGIYVGGVRDWNGEYIIQKRNLGTGFVSWEQLVWPGIPGAMSSECYGVRYYMGDVYGCGGLGYDPVMDQRPYVERRDIAAGALVWSIEETPVTYLYYQQIDVDATGVYVISSPEYGFPGAWCKLKSLALADGSEQWAVDVLCPVGAMGAIQNGIGDLKILGNKIYLSYQYFDAMLGYMACIESRDKATGAFIARDVFGPTPVINFWNITGISNFPAADEIIAAGQIEGAVPMDTDVYAADFLAALPAPPSGPTMDEIMRGCKWFSGGSFAGMYLGWR